METRVGLVSACVLGGVLTAVLEKEDLRPYLQFPSELPLEAISAVPQY
jgi:hypothetical protein